MVGTNSPLRRRVLARALVSVLAPSSGKLVPMLLGGKKIVRLLLQEPRTGIGINGSNLQSYPSRALQSPLYPRKAGPISPPKKVLNKISYPRVSRTPFLLSQPCLLLCIVPQYARRDLPYTLGHSLLARPRRGRERERVVAGSTSPRARPAAVAARLARRLRSFAAARLPEEGGRELLDEHRAVVRRRPWGCGSIPGARGHTGTVNIANQQFFFRPPVSVPLISLDQYRTERYSNNCMSRLGVPRGIRAGGPRLRASNRKTSWQTPISNVPGRKLQSPISLPPGPQSPISNARPGLSSVAIR
jgi:hypothetical protein